MAGRRRVREPTSLQSLLGRRIKRNQEKTAAGCGDHPATRPAARPAAHAASRSDGAEVRCGMTREVQVVASIVGRVMVDAGPASPHIRMRSSAIAVAAGQRPVGDDCQPQRDQFSASSRRVPLRSP